MKHWKNISIENIKGEIWMPIPNYDGIYEISNKGRVKRLISKNCLKERILKQCFSARYCRVVLSKNAIKITKAVHLYVAKVFVPNPKNLPLVCHADDDTTNNQSNNLWWGTQSDNIKDCHAKGRASFNLPRYTKYTHPCYGTKQSFERRKNQSDKIKTISNQQIEQAESMYRNGCSLREAAKRNGISPAYLSQLINGGYKRL